MAGRSVAELLAPEVILNTVSRIDLPGTTLQRVFGWNIGGGNKINHDAREGSYDIFDVTRRLASGVHPTSAAPRNKPQSMGKVRFTVPRAAEVIPLLDEEIHNRRRIGGPTADLDRGGQDYIVKQEEYMAQKFANVIEFQTAAMMRGSYTFTQSGDKLVHAFSGGEITVDYQIPAANKTKLNMLGAGDILGASWATSSTDIPAHLYSINNAMVQLTGQGLAHVVLTSVGWNHVLNNTKVQAQGGSANVVFQSIDRVGAGEFSCVLRALPWVTFHVVDYGLEIGTSDTYTKLIEDDHAAFFPDPAPRWTQYLEGGSYVTEGPNGVKEWRSGFYPYSYPTHDPSGWNLCAEHNGFPALYRPKAMAYGLIVY